MSKQALFNFIDKNEQVLNEMSDTIWEYAEIAMHEVKSSKLQREFLSARGFVIKDIPNIPTAFIAEVGSGKPVLGILGEYDALGGLSQKVSSVREAFTSLSDPGHGCGHNLLGVGGVAAAIALKDVMESEKIDGTLRYYGCPAEETLSGKVLMAKENVFNDLDAVVSWHPAQINAVWGCSFLALNSLKFRFKGIPAHAAAAPDSGRSALDAVELMNVGANYLREHVIEKARIHYVITNGGMAPNTVPPDAEVWYYIRAPKREQVRDITKRLLKVAEGAAMMTETKMSYELLAGCYDVVTNKLMGDLIYANMEECGPPKFDEADFAFAREFTSQMTREDRARVQSAYFAPDFIADMDLCDKIVKIDDRDKVMAGSVDGGDVSYIAPFAQFTAATWPIGSAAHTWTSTSCSGSSIGRKAMLFAGKIMAATLYDMFKDPAKVKAAREEFEKSLGGFKYVSPYNEGV